MKLLYATLLVLCCAFLPGSLVAAADGPNDRIVFARFDPDTVAPHIYSVRSNGSELVKLTSIIGLQPTWSPDASRIAFGGGLSNPGIYVMNPDGTGLTRIHEGPRDGAPSWSPDGTKIVFAGDGGGRVQLFLMNPDGTGVSQITNETNADDSSPDWSPDGSRLVFEKRSSVGGLSVRVINVDGTGETLITGVVAAFRPAWQGPHILFDRYVSGWDQMFSIDPDGSNEHQITNEAIDSFGQGWSPDAQDIAVSRGVGWKELWRMKSDGTGQVRITTAVSTPTDHSDDYDPDWTSASAPIPTPTPAGPIGGTVTLTAKVDGDHNGLWMFPTIAVILTTAAVIGWLWRHKRRAQHFI